MADNVDILMKIVDDQGAVIGESQSMLTHGDAFTKGFEPGLFFDIKDYDLDVALRDDEGGGKKGKSEDEHAPPRRAAFSQWLGGTGSAPAGYPVEVQPFQFTKQLDQTSPLLFYFCANSVPLKSATMVARKASGQKYSAAPSGGQTVVQQGYWGYLRIDFFDVLVTSVSWDVDEAVSKEKVKLICRRIQVQYRAQQPDGSMSEPIGVEWKFNAGLATG